MSKQYTITYEHTGPMKGEYTTNSLFDLVNKLDELETNSFIINESVVVNTKEVKDEKH